MQELIRKVSILILLLCMGCVVYYLTQETKTNDIYQKLKEKYTNQDIEGFTSSVAMSAPEIYQQYTGGIPLIKEIKDELPSSIQKILKPNANTNIDFKLVSKCLDCEQLFNTFGFLTKNNNNNVTLSLVNPSSKCKSNVNMLSHNNIVEKINNSRWKLIQGLLGPKYVSFYHMDMECYLARISNGSLHCLDIDLGNNIEKAMASFKLVDGLVDDNSVSLLCAPVHKETKQRLVHCNSNGSLDVIKVEDISSLDDINKQIDIAKQCQFKWLNIKTGNNMIQNKHHLLHKDKHCNLHTEAVNNKVIEGFASSDSTTGSGKSKSKRDKRTIRSLRKNNELGNAEISNMEASINEEFIVDNNQESLTNNMVLNNNGKGGSRGDRKRDIRVGGNIFKENTGNEFNKVLNKFIKTHKHELDDNILENIENAKLDPAVQNLLDFNEKRFKIYEKENSIFNTKLEDKLDDNTDKLTNNVRSLNNYRIEKLAEELFALQDELDKKRGIKN